jgi:hypothetical protein
MPRTRSMGNNLVSEKISVLRDEGKPQKQAVAMALSMKRAGRLRPGGVYVHAPRKRNVRKGSRRV